MRNGFRRNGHTPFMTSGNLTRFLGVLRQGQMCESPIIALDTLWCTLQIATRSPLSITKSCALPVVLLLHGVRAHSRLSWNIFSDKFEWYSNHPSISSGAKGLCESIMARNMYNEEKDHCVYPHNGAKTFWRYRAFETIPLITSYEIFS
jgi:hypothetical protein